MMLNMKIKNIKCIESFEISFPLEKGLYAITGENGSGKSTVITCASSAFFNMRMNDYFGKADSDSRIEFFLGEDSKIYEKQCDTNEWEWHGKLALKGFYEGSLIYGNRFRNNSYGNLRKLELIDGGSLTNAHDYILHNLGYILHNNKNYYEKLYIVKKDYFKSQGIKTIKDDLFYYEKNGKKISQFHMSTGENLLLCILKSLLNRNIDRNDKSIPCLILLDEIEMALHPSSLKRLVSFLKEESDKYNYAIYFSTHSIEIISAIEPNNNFFLNRHIDNTLETVNPCYPAYATRMLYDLTGYDYVILVEDELAKTLVLRILKNYSLLGNKLVHVLPVGGFSNVIEFGYEVVNNNLMGRVSRILIILDGDVKQEAEAYISKRQLRNNIPINYLPIESIEKYLKKNLIDTVDIELFRFLNYYIFQRKSLNEITQEYQNSDDYKTDSSGKKFYKHIDDELRSCRKTKVEIVDLIVDYLIKSKSKELDKLVSFLSEKLSSR